MNEQVEVEAWARAGKPYPKGSTITVAGTWGESHFTTFAGEDIPEGARFGLSPISGAWVLTGEAGEGG